MMTMENNLARIDYHLYGQGNELPTLKCSTNALIVLESVPEEEALSA